MAALAGQWYGGFMHELSIAQSIIGGVADVARENGAKKVTRICLQVGALSGVVKDSLLFCFPVAAKDTIMEDAQLQIEEIPLTISCPSCRQEYVQDECIVRCPKCDSTDVEIIKGRELSIKKIDFI